MAIIGSVCGIKQGMKVQGLKTTFKIIICLLGKTIKRKKWKRRDQKFTFHPFEDNIDMDPPNSTTKATSGMKVCKLIYITPKTSLPNQSWTCINYHPKYGMKMQYQGKNFDFLLYHTLTKENQNLHGSSFQLPFLFSTSLAKHILNKLTVTCLNGSQMSYIHGVPVRTD